MSTWDKVGENEGQTEGKKNEFTRFPEGDTFITIIDDEPVIRWTHWFPKHKRAFNCPGRGCLICDIRAKQKEAGEQYSYSSAKRFAINIWNHNTNRLEIMEQGQGFFEDLKDLRIDLIENNKVFADVKLRVRRRGLGQFDTSYRIDISDDIEFTDKQMEEIKERINLAEYYKPNTNEQAQRLLNGETWDEVMYGDEREQRKAEEETEEEVEYELE